MESLHGDAGPQYLLCVIVNLVSFAYGTIVGWLGPMQPLLQNTSNSTNFTSPLGSDVDPLTSDDISWITGWFCIGGIIGTPLFGYLPNKFGRKKTIVTVALSLLIGDLLILMATHPYYIFAGRLVSGLGGAGLCVIVPMYIGETAEDHIRGMLGSCFSLLICLGILFSYIVGSFTSYLTLTLTSALFPIAFLLASIWLPETPIYSLLNNKTEEALNTLIKLRGNHKELIEKELKNLVSSVKDLTSNEEKMSWKDLITDTATRKALFIGCFLMTVQQLSGIGPVINFLFKIFEDTKIDISPNIAAIVVALLQVAGAIIATSIVERAGRKLLLLVSSGGMALALTFMAIFFFLKDEHDTDPKLLEYVNWLPLPSMIVYIIVFNLGFGPVPWILFSEIFKTEARGPASSFCVLLIWAESFIILKFYPGLNETLGNSICFAFFAGNCALGAIVTFFCIPETKGKSLEMILKKLGGEKDTSESKPEISDKKLVV